MSVATNPKPNIPLQYLGFEALKQRCEVAHKDRSASFFWKSSSCKKQSHAHLRSPPPPPLGSQCGWEDPS